MGISVAVDSPGVGANLSDHPMAPVIWSTPKVKGIWEKTGTIGSLRWQFTHRGPLASNVGRIRRLRPLRCQAGRAGAGRHVVPAPFGDQGLADPSQRAMSVLVTLVDVASRGWIRLRSDDPRHRPAIDPGYLSDDDGIDATALLTGLKMAREFVKAQPMARICDAERRQAQAPGPTTSYSTTCAPAWAPSSTRWAPARWASGGPAWSTQSSRSGARPACGWSTHR